VAVVDVVVVVVEVTLLTTSRRTARQVLNVATARLGQLNAVIL